MLETANKLKKEIDEIKEFLSYFKIEKQRTKLVIFTLSKEYINKFYLFKGISFDSSLKTSSVIIPEPMIPTIHELTNKLLEEKQIEYNNLWRS